MKVFLISGHAQHGKDTVAGILGDYLVNEVNARACIIHFADLLKYICGSYFQWDGNKDKYGRNLLQTIGTDIVRGRDPNFWVDFVVRLLKVFRDVWDYVIIPDTRFPNEIEQMKKAGFDVTHIRVIRGNFDSPLTIEQQNHPSEIALDNVNADYYIYNSSNLSEVYKTVVRLAEEKLV